MAQYWRMVAAILGGAEAMRAVGGGGNVAGPATPVANLRNLDPAGQNIPQSPYLPKFPNETALDYACRLRHAPLTNLYADISRNLSSKPFSKECALDEDEPEELQKLSENIDGQGNNLHVFAATTFKAGLDYAIDWILVDYTRVPAGATLDAERKIGARPYWVHIQAERMIAVYSEFLNGREVIYHARICEPGTKRVGYAEQSVERVRVLNRERILDDAGNLIGHGPAFWELYEEVTTKDDAGKETTAWVVVGGGVYTIGILPLVPYMTGRRSGASWRVDPPLKDVAYMQVEEFQQESNLKTIKEKAAFPIVAGNGVSNKDEHGNLIEVVPTGPGVVLFAPPNGEGAHGEWTFIEPSAQSLTFLQSDLEKTRTEMRNLGMQPLASANLTVVTTANVSMKASSAVQAWALGLKDSLEQAWKITCMWLRQDREPSVNVHMDFAVELDAKSDLEALAKAEQDKVISKRLRFNELKRRGTIADDSDFDKDQEEVAKESEGLDGEQAIDPRTGQPIVVAPQPGIPNPPPQMVQ